MLSPQHDRDVRRDRAVRPDAQSSFRILLPAVNDRLSVRPRAKGDTAAANQALKGARLPRLSQRAQESSHDELIVPYRGASGA
jgi:hypothetical protein